ncbi:MAG: FMN-binding protein [Phycisphaerae bacterium]|nr:FMN-binding protein [Phycisphaerae bacterium]
MKGSLYTLIYAAVVGIVCAATLTFAANFCRPYREKNEAAEKQINILLALNVPFDVDATADELLQIFDANIKQVEQNGMAIYNYEVNGKLDSLAVEFIGPGRNATVKGFLALEPDRKTIKGITFYQQEETPGLGGEIITAEFRDRFKGKSIYDEKGEPGFVVKKNADKLKNGVNAISSATQTCDKLGIMLTETLKSLSQEQVDE